MNGFVRRLAVNLIGGARLLLPGPSPRFAATLAQLLALVLLGWLCAAAADLLRPGTSADWSATGLAFEAARGYVWLFALALVAASERGGRHFLPLAVACAAADVWFWGVWLGVGTAWSALAPDSYERRLPLFWWLLFGWQVAAFARALVLARGGYHWRVPLFGALYAAVLYVNLELMPDAALFHRAPLDGGAPMVNVENTYYRQAALLDAVIGGLAPQRPGVADWYFVGFGGYAAEAVFRREVKQVRDILAERLGTGRRSVLLVNSPATVDELPLANGSNLQYVLNSVARRMDVDEDALFVFLTSHGLEVGELAVEFEPLGLNNLTPDELRAALDAAGIRWRVLVISACYSGQFLDALESPTTLVITAAAEDKSSFGCAHENRWTYFGAAYFDDALRETRSPTQAFELARARIARREQKEGKEPSEPQMRLGAEIDARFPEWRR